MRHAQNLSAHGHRTTRRFAPAIALSLILSTAAPLNATQPPGEADPVVVTTWNQIAAETIPPNPAAFLNYAFVHLAMYNAVVGITGEYELYQWDVRGPAKASPEAAAAVAAHRILTTYFGGTAGVAATLDAALASSLGGVPDGVRKNQGVRYGLSAADRIIALRTGDGRGAAVTVPVADGPGDWNPIPSVPFAVPWLGHVTPLLLPSLGMLDPGQPPAIGTDLYRTELAEVRVYGAADSAVRTEWQTRMARYFADVPFRPMEAAFRDLATRHSLDISDSARLFAATNATMADALGTVWRSKLAYMWWRPITAIHEVFDDGDPLTEADPTWMPLIGNPPYPEWPSGLCAVVGAMSASLVRLTGQLDLNLVSPSQGLEHWTDKATFDQTAIGARVWSGIHFRTSDAVSIGIGTGAANLALDHYFAPAH